MTISWIGSQGLTASADTTDPYNATTRSFPSSTEVGRLFLLICGGKPYSTSYDLTSFASSFTTLARSESGTTGRGNGTGSTWVDVRYALGETSVYAGDTVDIQPDDEYSPFIRVGCAISKDDDYWDIAVSTGADGTSSGTTFSATAAEDPGYTTDDMIVVAVVFPDDTVDAIGSLDIDVPGCTLGTITLQNSTVTTTAGQDGAIHIYEATVASGTSTGAPTISGTVANNDSEGAVVFIRLRETNTAPGGDTPVGQEVGAVWDVRRIVSITSDPIAKRGAEMGTDGATVSIADQPPVGGSSFDFVTIPVGDSLTYDNDFSAHGTQSVEAKSTSNPGPTVGWDDNTLGSLSTAAMRAYTRLPIGGVSAFTIIGDLADGETSILSVRVNSNNKLALYSNELSAQIAVTSAEMPIDGSWFRWEIKAVAGATDGHAAMRVFYGNDLFSSIATEEVGDLADDLAFGNTSFDTATFGMVTNNGSPTELTLNYDDVAVGTDWIGPPPPAFTAVWNVATTVSDTLEVPWDVLTPIGQAVQAVWDARAAAGRAVAAVWGTSAAVGDSLQSVWNVATSIAKTVEAVWDTAAAVGEEVAAVWDTRAAIGQEITTLWNVASPLAAVGRAVSFVWDTLETVGQEAVLEWRTRAAVGQSVATPWHLRAAVGQSAQAVWHIAGSVGQSVANVWHLRAGIGQSVAIPWHIRSAVGQSVGTLWRIAVSVGQLVAAQWRVRALAGQAVEAVWSTRAAVGKSVQTIWDTLQVGAVGRSLVYRWNVRETVGQPAEIQWRVRAGISQSLQAVWSVRGVVAETLQAVWGVRATAAQAIQAVWGVRTTAAKAVQAVWATRSAVGQQTEIIWSVAATVGQSVQAVWDVISTSAVGNAAQAVWRTRASVGSETQAVWSVRVAVGQAVQTLWDVISTSAVGQAVGIAWHTRANVGQSVEAVWGLRALVANTVATTWDTLTTAAQSLEVPWSVRTFVGSAVAARWRVRALAGQAVSAVWGVRVLVAAVGSNISLVWGIRTLIGGTVTTVWRLLPNSWQPLFVRETRNIDETVDFDNPDLYHRVTDEGDTLDSSGTGDLYYRQTDESETTYTR